MGSKTSIILLLLTAFIGGFVLMSMELVYPRISIIWFGNVLSVWAIDLSMSLISIAIGYWIGSLLISRKKRNIITYLFSIYLFTAAYLLLMKFINHDMLEMISQMDVISGSVVFSLLFMFPTMGLLAVTSPILVYLKNSVSTKNTSSSSLIFGTSTIGGAISMLAVGLYSLPYLGINITILALSGLLIFISFLLLIFKLKRENIVE